MKEWIIENTTISEEEYDKLINLNTTKINNEVISMLSYTKNSIYESILLAICTYAEEKSTFIRNIMFSVHKDGHAYIHKEIKFYILAEFIELYQKEFYHNQQLGKCFEISTILCNQLDSSNIITFLGLNPDYKEPTYILHSVVSVKDKRGNEYILDGASNIIMNKKTYLNLFDAKVVSIVSRQELLEAYQLIFKYHLDSCIYDAEYLCFPNEVIASIKRLTKRK